MVKTPKTRHSKVHRNPVTIDLGPDEVSRIEETRPADEQAADPTAGETTTAETTAAGGTVSESPREEPTEANEPQAGRSLDEELTARIGSEQPYTGTYGRSAGEGQADTPQDEPGMFSGRGLLAGLLGGMIALVGAGGLQYAGLLPVSGSGETNNLRAEIATLRQQVRDNAGSADADDLRRVLSDSNARVDGLAVALEKVENDLGSLRAAISSGGNGVGATVQNLGQKVDELERALAALHDSAETRDALNKKIASMESAARTAADAANARLAGLEEKVAGIEGKIEGQADQSRVALAIAASGLKAAVDRGGSFSSELDTFASVVPDASELQELRPFAVEGISSRADLMAALPDAANAMIDASQALDENAGVIDRFVASARSLVKVRPTGAVEGEGVPEKVARLEAAVKEGNLAKALDEYNSLPELSRAAGAGFADSLRGRLKVEELVDKALASALKAS